MTSSLLLPGSPVVSTRREGAGTGRAEPQRRLAEYYTAVVDSGLPVWHHAVRHPRAALTAAGDIRRLPERQADIAATATGRALVATLTSPGPLRMPLGRLGVAVLDVPADPLEYSQGASKQTLRRKVRLAQRSGITWRAVQDPQERAALLRIADDAEAAHADERYRVQVPRNDDLMGIDLWLAAFSADGTPLLLSVTPTESGWGHLRYFRTLGSGPEHSDSRYLMTQALVETLAARGVRQLVDGVHPVDLPNGLRHFQRMVGFQLTRIQVRLVP